MSRHIRARGLRTAFMLFAVLSLVVARAVTATAGLALPAVSGQVEYCAVAGHAGASAVVEQHHHVLAHAHGADHEITSACDPKQPGPSHYHDVLPCCMTGAAVVLPAVGHVVKPVASARGRVQRDSAKVLEDTAPEGPTEPPRSCDQA